MAISIAQIFYHAVCDAVVLLLIDVWFKILYLVGTHVLIRRYYKQYSKFYFLLMFLFRLFGIWHYIYKLLHLCVLSTNVFWQLLMPPLQVSYRINGETSGIGFHNTVLCCALRYVLDFVSTAIVCFYFYCWLYYWSS